MTCCVPSGKAYENPEVQGELAAKYFLFALFKKMAPEWANHQAAQPIQNDIIGVPTLSLEQLGKVFAGILHENELRGLNNLSGPFGFC